jgi:hypothetical protein
MDLIRELLLHIEAKFNDRGYGPVAGITAIAINIAVAVLAFATAMATVAIL